MDTLWTWVGPVSPASVALLALLLAAGIIWIASWIALPFAVHGLKPHLRELLEAQREANRRLAGIERALDALAKRQQMRPPLDPLRREFPEL